jgi:magnesium chelatase family protein
VIDYSDLPIDLQTAAESLTTAVWAGDRILLRSVDDGGPVALARRIPSVLPPLTSHQRLWLAVEYAAQGLDSPDVRPFRAPHHTCSSAAIVGEARLARFGVLYLDNITEFSRAALAALAVALDKMGPTAPILVAQTDHRSACGLPPALCQCSEIAIHEYQHAIVSAALLLGVDVKIAVPALPRLRIGDAASLRCASSAELRKPHELAWNVASDHAINAAIERSQGGR